MLSVTYKYSMSRCLWKKASTTIIVGYQFKPKQTKDDTGTNDTDTTPDSDNSNSDSLKQHRHRPAANSVVFTVVAQAVVVDVVVAKAQSINSDDCLSKTKASNTCFRRATTNVPTNGIYVCKSSSSNHGTVQYTCIPVSNNVHQLRTF